MDPNIENVRHIIKCKINQNIPYYGQPPVVITDMDHFPYKRFFRGVYNQTHPQVMEREAGFRPRNDNCYVQMFIPKPQKTEYCWQYPCSQVKPCKAKKSDKEETNCYNISP